MNTLQVDFHNFFFYVIAQSICPIYISRTTVRFLVLSNTSSFNDFIFHVNNFIPDFTRYQMIWDKIILKINRKTIQNKFFISNWCKNNFKNKFQVKYIISRTFYCLDFYSFPKGLKYTYTQWKPIIDSIDNVSSGTMNDIA